jgi:hypothetical protein
VCGDDELFASVSRKWGADMKYDMRAGRYVIRRNAQILDVDRYRLPPCIYICRGIRCG